MGMFQNPACYAEERGVSGKDSGRLTPPSRTVSHTRARNRTRWVNNALARGVKDGLECTHCLCKACFTGNAFPHGLHVSPLSSAGVWCSVRRCSARTSWLAKLHSHCGHAPSSSRPRPSAHAPGHRGTRHKLRAANCPVSSSF